MNYEAMNVISLRKEVRSRGFRSSGIASASRAELVEFLEKLDAGEDAPEPGANGASTDLADILASALSGKIKSGVDREDVEAVINEVVPGLIETALTGREPKQIILNGVPKAEITEHVHVEFEKVCKLVSLGLPVLLVGPAGTGKTTLAGQVAKALDRRFSFNSMSAGCSESHIIGRTLPNSNGSWEYKPSPFVTTYGEGGVHLFDEVDAADPNLMVIINAALANGHLSIPFEDRVINRHEDTAIICAANTFGKGASREYVGRNALDAATLDRFAVSTVVIDYDRTLEQKLVSPMLGAEKTHALLNRCWIIREKIEENGLRRILSTRSIINIATRVSVGDSMNACIADFVAGWSDSEKQKIGETD